MKYFVLILIVLNQLLIYSQALRNLKLAIDPSKLETLTTAAKNTFKQIFLKDIDFKGTTIAKLEDEKHKFEIIIYDDQNIPSAADSFRFDINNWKPTVPDYEMSKTKINIFGKIYDIKDQFTIFTNAVATGYKNGFAIVYKKSGEDVVANMRYKCFVNSDSGDAVGSFEIYQVDKNDSTNILDTLKNFFNTLDIINKGVKTISELVTTVIGIKKDLTGGDKNSISTFLNAPYLILFLVICL